MNSCVRWGALLLAAGVLVGAMTVRRAPTPDVDEFWTDFRRAVLGGDRKALEKIVHHPVESRGRQADLPVLKWNKEEFWRYWDGFLSRVEWRTDEGPTPVPCSRRAVIERWKRLPEEARRAAKTRTFRVVDMEFHCLSGQWRLVRLFRGE